MALSGTLSLAATFTAASVRAQSPVDFALPRRRRNRAHRRPRLRQPLLGRHRHGRRHRPQRPHAARRSLLGRRPHLARRWRGDESGPWTWQAATDDGADNGPERQRRRRTWRRTPAAHAASLRRRHAPGRRRRRAVLLARRHGMERRPPLRAGRLERVPRRARQAAVHRHPVRHHPVARRRQGDPASRVRRHGADHDRPASVRRPSTPRSPPSSSTACGPRPSCCGRSPKPTPARPSPKPTPFDSPATSSPAGAPSPRCGSWAATADSSKTSPRWQRLGREMFADQPDQLVTLHPCGLSWVGDAFGNEEWFDFLGYQSGHGDGDDDLKWLAFGPPAQSQKLGKPVINLEPNYEGHPAYQSGKLHDAHAVRRAAYWSMLVSPPAGRHLRQQRNLVLERANRRRRKPRQPAANPPLARRRADRRHRRA